MCLNSDETMLRRRRKRRSCFHRQSILYFCGFAGVKVCGREKDDGKTGKKRGVFFAKYKQVQFVISYWIGQVVWRRAGTPL